MVRFQQLQEGFAVALGFDGADAGDGEEGFHGLRELGCHVLQGGVGEDYVGGNLLLFRKLCPEELGCESCAMYNENEERCGNEALQFCRGPQSWQYVRDTKNEQQCESPDT